MEYRMLVFAWVLFLSIDVFAQDQDVEALRKAAEQGNARAQLVLGFTYQKGEELPQDYAEAVKWFRKAAEQGHATAQTSLGLMYEIGQGVRQDYIQAYMWINLAASRGPDADKKKYSTIMDRVASRMTPTQIAEAQRLALDWKFEPTEPPLSRTTVVCTFAVVSEVTYENGQPARVNNFETLLRRV